MEHLDASIQCVGHGHDPAGAECDAAGIVKLAGATSPSIPAWAIPPYLICERAVGVEHLDAVVLSVGHGHDPAGAEGDAGRRSKLAGATSPSMYGAIPPYLIGERAVGMEHLDAFAGGTGHGHDPAGAEGDVVAKVLIVGIGAQIPCDPIGKRAVGMEHLDATLQTGHGHDPAGAEGDAHNVDKLAGALSRSAPSGAIPPYLIGERAVGVEHLDASIQCVGHGHDPAGAEGDACNVAKLACAISIRSADLIGKRGRLRADGMRGRQPRRGNGCDPDDNASHYH